MEKISLIKNEEGQICRKEIVENITPLDENQLVEARNQYDNLLNQRKDVEQRLNQLEDLIGEFNGVFDEVKSEESSEETDNETEPETE